MGYLRLPHFDTEGDRIIVNTYSPYLDKYNYYTKPGIDEFTIDLDLEPKLKRVATDSIQVNHLKGTAIGTPQKAASGAEVAQSWEGLEANGTYSWYVVAEDEFGGRAVSDVWTFTTTGESSKLAAPSKLKAQKVTTSSVQLEWEPVKGAEDETIRYHVYMDGERKATVTDSVYEITGLAPETAYKFTVTAVNIEDIESQPSEPLTVKTAAEAGAEAEKGAEAGAGAEAEEGTEAEAETGLEEGTETHLEEGAAVGEGSSSI